MGYGTSCPHYWAECGQIGRPEADSRPRLDRNSAAPAHGLPALSTVSIARCPYFYKLTTFLGRNSEINNLLMECFFFFVFIKGERAISSANSKDSTSATSFSAAATSEELKLSEIGKGRFWY